MNQPARREKLLPAEGTPETGEEELERRLESIWEAPHTLFGWLGTVDHKRIGIRYLVTAMAFLIVGGIEALVLRLHPLCMHTWRNGKKIGEELPAKGY